MLEPPQPTTREEHHPDPARGFQPESPVPDRPGSPVGLGVTSNSFLKPEMVQGGVDLIPTLIGRDFGI